MLAVVLPGRAYDVDQPLLADARAVLVAAGYDVRAVRWPGPPELTTPWVAERLLEAVGGYAGPVLVVGKSLGTRAAGLAAERGWPGIWLTPLLSDPGCVADLRAASAPALLVGGSADPSWDADVVDSLANSSRTVLELLRLDHALHDEAGVLTRRTRALVRGAVSAFASRLASSR